MPNTPHTCEYCGITCYCAGEPCEHNCQTVEAELDAQLMEHGIDPANVEYVLGEIARVLAVGSDEDEEC